MRDEKGSDVCNSGDSFVHLQSEVKRVISRAIHRAYDTGTIALKYIFLRKQKKKKKGGQGVSGQPVADVIIATKPLVPFYLFFRSFFLSHSFPIEAVVQYFFPSLY